MTLSQATKKLLLKDPFYGFILMELNKSFNDKDIDTAGVTMDGIGYKMIVNPVFWNSLSDDEQVEVLKHELLHICFFHPLEGDKYANKELANIAMDAEVNQYLDMTKMPEGVIDILSAFPGIKEKAGAKYYYDYLKQHGKGGLEPPENHGLWTRSLNDDTVLNKDNRTMIRNQVEHIMEIAENAVKTSQGTVPDNIKEYLDKIKQKSKVVFNWKAYLRRLCGTSDEYFSVHTRKRESRRFEGAAGTRHRHKANLLVAVDTSGSLNKKELNEFFVEIDGIAKRGIGVFVIECDCSIKRMYKYEIGVSGRDIRGRGGTDFQPVVDYYNSHRKEYGALVYFTDGGASLDLTIKGPSIWVISSDGIHQNYPGKTIYIPKEQ